MTHHEQHPTSRRGRSARTLALGTSLLVMGLLLSACGAAAPSAGAGADSRSEPSTEPSTGPSTGPSPAAIGLSGDVTVLAAASLTDTFTLLGEEFMAANPDVTVVLSFAGSSALATQITEGAPADVFASASPATMQTVVAAGNAVGEPTVFVTNTLQIAVPPDNPGRITGLVELTDPERTIALCAVEVPCGAASETVFAAAGLTPSPDTLEQDVRGALSKVELGEVDAGLVYRTDVIAAGDAVLGIDFPESAGAVNAYPIVTLAQAPTPDVADAFVAYVLSAQGRQVFTDAGFGTP